MKKASVYEAKTQLSGLLKRVERGEHIIIEKRGKPVAKLVPAGRMKRLGAGMDQGLGRVAVDFDSPLPAHVLDAFLK